MRHELQPAFILHRRPFRNTSLILEVFSREQGRIVLVARGAAQPKARLRGVLQPFQLLLLAWTERGELGTLIQAESQQLYSIPASSLFSALYLNELLLRLLAKHDPYPELFNYYQTALTQFAAEAAIEPLLRQFEKKLLEQIGYGLALEQDSDSGTPIADNSYYTYHPGQGLQADSHSGLSGKTVLALRDNRLQDIIEPEQLQQVKRLMRSAINACLDKPLRSRELMVQLHQRRQCHEHRLSND